MKNKTLKVLEVLKQNFGSFVSGENIAKLLKISRAGVYKIVNKLNKEGYHIIKNKKLGYKLINKKFAPEEVLKQNFRLIKKIYYYKTTDSTMNVAKEILTQQQIDKVLIIAEKQTEGKGRIQRRWFSPKGGIYFSLILKPQISPNKIFILNYLFSVAIAEVLRKKYFVNATTKWPNDVVVNDKKICGILIEADTEIDNVNWCIVGVGVNVNIKKEFFLNHDLNATSILAETKINYDLTKFLIDLLYEIDKWYQMFLKKNYSDIIKRWVEISSTVGKQVEVITFNERIQGKAVKILQETGALVVKTKSGFREILSGDCIHLR
ncbi:MAG: biotin--[acetyl-CoA-carboxylase] ligase [Endomicrobiia bacterium]